MPGKRFGQFCGLATALELVGERWALLIVRDLVLGPKRFSELKRSLPRIPTNILAARLKELEASGVIRRTLLARPAAGTAYDLTPFGRGLRPVILQLGAWGAQAMTTPSPDDIVTTDSLRLALEATFQPEAARGADVAFELHIGPVVLHARVRDGALETGGGPLEVPGTTIEAGPAFKALLAGELTPQQALDQGAARVSGDPKRLTRFVEIFRILRPSGGEASGRLSQGPASSV